MPRYLPLILLLALGCDDKDPAKSGPRIPANPLPPKPPVLPTTGGPRIKDLRESIVDDVERMEQELDAGTTPERRFVDAAKKGVANLVIAARMAVDLEAEDTVRQELSILRERQGALDQGRNELAAGIVEIESLLQQERPPEGFTVDELKDRLGERQEQLRALDKDEDEIRARMKEKEDLLSRAKIPPQGTTVRTRELEAVMELKARVDALEARLK